MSTEGDGGSDRSTTGYGRPPKSGQFRKGQSGNPRGRPPKAAVRSEPPEARFPTRQVIREQAVRPIAINDASGREMITTREAIVRSLHNNAMRGGVLAQRTALELFRQEDERYHLERKKIFDFWDNYKFDCAVAIKKAIALGAPIPEFLPHPEDVVLDEHALTVRVVGAGDEESRKFEIWAEKVQSLAFEMAFFTGEDNCLPGERGCDAGRLGFYMCFYLLAASALPPRLRRPLDADDKRIQAWALGPRSLWRQDLIARCSEAEIPFLVMPKNRFPPTRSFAECGIYWDNVAVIAGGTRKRTKR